MKKRFLFLFILLAGFVKSQDTLFFKSAEKLPILLLEVNPDNIKYKRFDNQAGAVYTILKSDISKIVLSNGKTEKFEQQAVTIKKDTLAAESRITKTGADTIIFTSGKKTIATVNLVGDKSVKYRLFNYPDGPLYEAYKYEIKQITYSSGMVQKFESNQDYSAPTSSSNGTMYQKGKTDALRYYRHPGGSIGTGCASAVPCYGIGLGLIPALIVTNNEPAKENLGIPVSSYSNNSDYLRGYKEQAYKMKKKKVWTTYGVAAGVSSIAAIILIAIVGGM